MIQCAVSACCISGCLVHSHPPQRVLPVSTTAVNSLLAVQCKQLNHTHIDYSYSHIYPPHQAAPKLSNTQTLPTHLTYITSTMPTSSRFTEHIDTATTRQSTSPECDVRLDDILKMSISQTHTQKARAWSGSSSNSSASSREEQPAMQQEKKTKRGSRFLGRKV